MKNEFFVANTVLVILLLILLYVVYKPGTVVKSDVDGLEYFVSERDDKQEIANTLATIRQRINILANHLQSQNNGEYQNYANELIKTVQNIDISENTKNIYTSYTINKRELVFCVRSKETDKIHDINLLMYVVIHELAHIACPEYGHGELFKKIFKYLLSESEKCGIYKSINFSMNPKEYCGMKITVG